MGPGFALAFRAMSAHRRADPRLAAVAILWLLLGALIPAGYMPRFAGGMIRVELCNGAGEHRAVDIPLNGRPRPHHDGVDMCGYAGVGPGFAGAPPELAQPPFTAASDRVATSAIFARPHRAAFNPNAPPLAPPALFV